MSKRAPSTNTTGLTKDAGWELGVRTTVPAPLNAVWDYLVGEGLQVWLGTIDALPTEKGAEYRTDEGTRGTVRGFTPYNRLRVGWQPKGQRHETVLQLTVREAANGTTIGIHQEKMLDRDERWKMLGHWKLVTAELEVLFGKDA